MEKVCIRCGASSTPLWRPEVLAGPKVLCNACGVKLMYSNRAKRLRLGGLTHKDQQNRCHGSVQHPSGFTKTAKHQHSMKGIDGNSNPFAHPRKKQRTHPTEGGDVKLSPLQKQHLQVERHLDTDDRNILEWTITDTSIDDTRRFQNLTHAQAFIDECWAFISTDIRRDTGSDDSPNDANKRQKAQLGPGVSKVPSSQQQNRSTLQLDAESPEQSQPIQQLSVQMIPARKWHRSSHSPEAVAAADQQPFSTEEHHGQQLQLLTAGRQTSPAERAKSAALEKSPSMHSPGSTAVCNDQASFSREHTPLTTHAAAAPASPVIAKTASITASFSRDRSPCVPHAAAAAGPSARTAAPAASPAAAPAAPRWPCNSKRMANVTELHGGKAKQPAKRSKHHARAAFDSPAAASASRSPAGQSHPWHTVGLRGHQGYQSPDPDQLSSSPQAVFTQTQPDQTCHHVLVRSGHSTSSSPDSPLASPSQPQVKLEQADLDMPSSSSTANHQLPSELACQHEQLQCGIPKLQSHARHSPSQRLRSSMIAADAPHTSSQAQASTPKSRLKGSGAPAKAPVDNSTRQHWQLSKANSTQFERSPSSTAQHAGSGRASGLQAGLSLYKKTLREASQQGTSMMLARVNLSWGRRKPRTRRQPRLSDDSTAELATVAATAAAEAEQAAAAAAATARTRFEEAASQSRAHEEPAAKRPCRKQNSFHSHSTARDRSAHGPPAGDEAASPKQGGPRSGRQHHRAGALPSNLNKSLGYIGSTYLGVNGVKHGPDLALRWRAGTWDPVIKKTVYIGSYDTELGAATAVDAWHVSQGREAVNFPPKPDLAPNVRLGTQSQRKRDSMPELDSLSESPAAESHLHQAAALLKSLRPQHSEQVELAQKPLGLQQPSVIAHHGVARHLGSKSQRQSAAGALVANAAGRPRINRDGTGKARQFSRERLAASLCGKQKW